MMMGRGREWVAATPSVSCREPDCTLSTYVFEVCTMYPPLTPGPAVYRITLLTGHRGQRTERVTLATIHTVAPRVCVRRLY